MTCNSTYSESGALCSIQGCAEYIKLLSEKSRLEGRCAGLEEGNKLNQGAIKRQDARMVEILAENAVLRSALVTCQLESGTSNLLQSRGLNMFSMHLAEAEKERSRLAAIVEKADALAEASESSYCYPDKLKDARDAYKEARNG